MIRDHRGLSCCGALGDRGAEVLLEKVMNELLRAEMTEHQTDSVDHGKRLWLLLNNKL